MEFSDVVRQRRMVRSYDSTRTVTREQLEALLALAIRAPSAGYTQGWEFLVLTGTDLERYWRVCTDPAATPDAWLKGMMTAPALIIPLADKSAYLDRYSEADKGWTDRDEARWPVPYWLTDTAMAALLVLLAAVDTGLASCFFGIPTDRVDAVMATFEIPRQLQPIGAITIGYPAPDRRSPSLQRGRRPVQTVTHWGSF